MGYWALILAWVGNDDKGYAMVFGDGFVFIPGLVQLVWLLM